MIRLTKIIDRLLCIVFPARCACCNQIIKPGKQICDYCNDSLKKAENLCVLCGNNSDRCVCKKRKFLFDGITAPFYNLGSAQNGIYGLKFKNRLHCAVFFADRMAENLVKAFPGTHYDVVTCVPMSSKSLRKRRYNQAEVLASLVARRLGVEFRPELIKKVRSNLLQHTLKFNQRASNVEGVYSVSGEVNKLQVLLVDDIKTSGSTLNECAKQLKLCGAKNVVCLCALVSKTTLV
ncbi:MAG: phosphoribosyltransferase family protein [bacterium]|nr:phosphoribosyltransferase family protein [bacterium]